MTAYVALLRAVNVGGTGKLPMAELTAICARAGFAHVRTYIASGNVVFTSGDGEAAVKAALEAGLRAHAGAPIDVMVRTAAEMADVLTANPFAAVAPELVAALFLDAPPPADAASRASGRRDEAIVLGRRVIYVHYPSGMGRSTLKLPAAAQGTARNMNTVAKLAKMSARLDPYIA